MEEKQYPIYYFYANWNQDNYKGNCTGYSMMYRNELTEDEIQLELNEFKTRIINKQISDEHPVIDWIDLGYIFKGHDTWFCDWFNHITYNQFETNKETFISFEKYLERKRKENIDEDSLMGAFDRYRWEICRCDGCKKRGITMIMH